MKKLVVIFLLILSLAAMLTSCGKYRCDFCGEEKYFGKNESKVYGRTIIYCDACEEELDEMEDEINDELEDLENAFSDLFG